MKQTRQTFAAAIRQLKELGAWDPTQPIAGKLIAMWELLDHEQRHAK